MRTTAHPLRIVEVRGGRVQDFHADPSAYVEGFSYEWENYGRTQTDSTLGTNLSEKRLELNLGFPLTFLKGMNVLELGCGPGRFTEQLATHAKHVVAVDLSNAIFNNVALGRKNCTFIHGDLLEVPALSEPIDLVFCRGVIQHTPDPRQTIRRLFDYCRPGGLVIFDVYKKSGYPNWRQTKYFWRPILQKHVPLDTFDQFISKHDTFLYNAHHALLKIWRRQPFYAVMKRTPFFINNDWNAQYPQLTREQRQETFKAELIDMFYSGYDQPMSPQEVIDTLAAFGQYPYSYDVNRNHYRCMKAAETSPKTAIFTKNGVIFTEAA